jgi:sugar-specific transcriptional regulator TrmB
MLIVLQRLGLTHSEAKVYLALSHLDESTVGPIVAQSRVANSKIYPLLEKLKNKGLVSEILKHNVKYFSAANPNRLKELVQQKEKELHDLNKAVDEIIPKLQSLLAKPKQETKMFEGLSGYTSILTEICADLREKEEYLIFGSQRELSENEIRILRQHLRECNNKNIQIKIIYHRKNDMGEKLRKDGHIIQKNMQIKTVPNNHSGSILITKKSIALISWDENPIQVYIKSESFAKMYQKEFKELWDQN